MKHTRFQYAFIVAPQLKCSGIDVTGDQLQLMIAREKEHAGCKLGQLIARHIGFTEQEDLDSANDKRYVLDVIAFSTDEWTRFKRDLRAFLINTLMKDSDLDKVKGLFNQLEDPDESTKEGKEVSK